MQFIVYNVLVCCHILDAGIQVVQVWIQVFFRGIFLVCVRARGWGVRISHPAYITPYRPEYLVCSDFDRNQIQVKLKLYDIVFLYALQSQQDFVLMSDSASAPKHRSSYTSCSNSCSNYIFWHVVITILFSILPKAVTDKTFATRFTWWTIS